MGDLLMNIIRQKHWENLEKKYKEGTLKTDDRLKQILEARILAKAQEEENANDESNSGDPQVSND
jgi:hypothetical protein